MQASEDNAITAMHRWNLWIPGFLLVIAALGSFSSDSIGSLTGLPSLGIESAAAVIFVIVVIAMIRAARCLRCKQNLLIRSMSKESAANWLTRFIEMESCPCCGYTRGAHR
jgi:peptidoglycan/LPS O-acetylase OafA/YrhL